MNFEQHENNIFTKEYTDIERYLLRIIRRYFDINIDYSNESIEAIITESLARYKQDIIHEKGGFLFSFNQRTGHIVVTIEDLHGEKSFDKQTAFNKDFGNEHGTVCKGSDKRLSNARKPLPHIHEITDLEELKTEIGKITLNKTTHIHNNPTILDMLRYTGTQAKIDLIVLDFLESNINYYFDGLIYHQNETRTIKNKALDELENCTVNTINNLNYVKQIANNVIQWIGNSYKYTDNKINQLINSCLSQLSGYITKEEYNKKLGKIPYMLSDNELSINSNGQFKIFNLPDNSTNVVEEIRIPINVSNQLKTHFRYDNGTGISTIPLPYIHKINTKDSIIIQLRKENNLHYVEINIINNIPHQITQANINSSTITIDNNVYNLKHLSYYFNNPRIYYQVLGMQEV